MDDGGGDGAPSQSDDFEFLTTVTMTTRPGRQKDDKSKKNDESKKDDNADKDE